MIKLGFDNDGDFVVASVKGEMCILKIDVDWFFNDEVDDEVPCIMFRDAETSKSVFPDTLYAVIKKEDFRKQEWGEDFYPEEEQ